MLTDRSHAKILGLIVGRGGSKGIPGKNIKFLCGKPLLYYTIKAAKESTLLSALCISTDDKLIANCAAQYDIEVPFIRPLELATSSSSAADVVLHALEFFTKKGINYDAVCLLQPTCPFRPKGHLEKIINVWLKSDCETATSVLPVPDVFNPHWVMFREKDSLTPAISYSNITSRQNLPEAFRRSGAAYIASSDFVRRTGKLIAERTAFVGVCEKHHVNLDTFSDWSKAEKLFESRDEINNCCGGIYE